MGDSKIRLELCNEDEHTSICSLLYQLNPINITYASFTYLGDKGKRRYYFSDREWGKVSLKKKYPLYDPVVRVAINLRPAVLNWRYVSYDPKSSIINQERKSRLNICSGYSVKADEDGSFLSIATPNPDFNIRKYLQEDILRILAFGKLCHRVLCHA
jgi:hypothetical protein